MEDYISKKISDGRRKQGRLAEYDYKNVVVVASVWLLFYVTMLGGLLDNRGREFLASVSDLLAQN
jgi:hypothetical protein